VKHAHTVARVREAHFKYQTWSNCICLDFQ